jgi:dihydrofolate reductase
MGKLVVTEFVTLDGVFEDPGGAEGFEHGGWSFQFDRGPEGDEFKFDELRDAEAQLLGRVTYDGFAKAWPTMRGDEFGERMNSMPKYVVSDTLETLDWENSHRIPGAGALEEVASLKEQIEGDILVAGSGRLVRSLSDAGLVDEFHLMVFPIVLGTGRRLFEGVNTVSKLRLADARQSGDTLILTYVPR